LVISVLFLNIKRKTSKKYLNLSKYWLYSSMDRTSVF
jgi:hypothetical protein